MAQHPHPEELAAAGARAMIRLPLKSFQARVAGWMQQCFGSAIAADVQERGDRFLEEALELLQSHGYDPARVARLRDYVWSRPVGEPAQEIGGVMVTLAAYCTATSIDLESAAEAELARILSPEVIERIRQKQEAKRDIHSPLPGAVQSCNGRELTPHPTPTPPNVQRGPEMSETQKLEWSAPLCGGKRADYDDAEQAVADLGPDWRIPTDKEWDTVIDRSKYDPAIDTDQVPDVALGYHWTSTRCPWAPESAVFVVDTHFGGVSYDGRGYGCFVRAVRAVPGQ